MKKFLQNLLPPKKNRRSKKHKSVLVKRIWIGIGIFFLLIGIVLFSTNIDTILDFFGVRAGQQATIDISLDPPEGPPGDPPDGPIVNLGPNQSYTWYLNIKSIWGTHPTTGDPQPFKGTVTFFPPDLTNLYPNFIDSVVLEVPEHPDTLGSPKNDPTEPKITITDSPDDCPMLGVCNWRPVTADQEFVDPSVYLTITTKDYDPSMGDFEIPFEVPVTLYYNPTAGSASIPDPDDPASEILPPPPAEGTIYLEGENIIPPNFTLEILEPKDQIVNTGINANYIIKLTANESFGLDPTEQQITIDSTTLDGIIPSGWLVDPYYTFGDNTEAGEYTVPIETNQSVNVPLTIYTNPDLSSSESFPFIVNGSSEQINSYIAAGGSAGMMSYIVEDSDGGNLLIEPVLDFSITLGNIVASTTYKDDLDRDVVTPGSSITYNMTLNRINGFDGNVTVNSNSLNTNWPTEINYYEFEIDGVTTLNNGLFIYQGDDVQTGFITIYITDDENTQIRDIGKDISNPLDPPLFLDGYGDIDGDDIPEYRPSNEGKFSIVDYYITISDTPQTVGAGSDAIYNIVITPENKFNDIVRLGLIENLIIDYPEHIINPYPDWSLDEVTIISSTTDITIQLTLHTNSTSPGTDLTGIPFHVQGTSVGLFRHQESNEGVLHITSQRDFTIQLTSIKNRIISGGEATYTVTATGLLGFSDPIDLSTTWDVPNMPSWISSISFDDDTIIPGNSIPGNPTILHITTTIDAPPINSDPPEDEGCFAVIGTSGTHPARFAYGTLNIVDFAIQIINPAPDISGNSIRTIASGDETTYTAIVTRMTNLFEPITLSTDLVSVNGSISNLTFEGPEVVYIAGEYILQYTDSLTQTITLRVTTFNPIPAETINFHIYGDVTTAESDAFQRQSNMGILIITNDYGFELTINPSIHTVAPTGEVEYTIGVTRLNDFTEDITLVSTISELDGEQVSYKFDTDILSLNPVFPFLSDTATLTVTANADALGKLIPFKVWGYTDLGSARIAYDDVGGEINIIDFTLDVLPNTSQTIGPGDTVQYTIHLQATGTTIFTKNITLSTNINDASKDTRDIIELAWFSQPIINNVNSTTGTDVILNIKAFSTIADTVPNHSISFDVYGNSDVDTVHLRKSDNGILDFKNTAYFTLTVSPKDEYSYPGGAVSYLVTVEGFNEFNDTIVLDFTPLSNPLIDYPNSGFDDTNLILTTTNSIQTTNLKITAADITGSGGNVLITVNGVSSIAGTEQDITNLHVRDFEIIVTPLAIGPNPNTTYPNSIIQYRVNLTRYNRENHDEDIHLTSNVYAVDSEHILPFTPSLDFSKGGIFNSGVDSDLIIMTIHTSSVTDNLPTPQLWFNVTGTEINTTPALTRSSTNWLEILSTPDFTLTLEPKIDGRGIPTETIGYTITLTRDSEFTDPVTINNVSVISDDTGLPLTYMNTPEFPDGIVFNGPGPIEQMNLYITLTDPLIIDNGSSQGNYTVTITGTSPSVSDKYASAPLIVMDFAISLTDNTKDVTPNSNVSYEVVLTRYNGYDREVVASTNLATDWPTDIATVSFNLSNDIFPDPGINPGEDLQQTALMTVYTTQTASDQTITFEVTGTDNTPTALQRSVNGILNIVSSPDYRLTLYAKDGVDSGMPTERVTYIVELETLNGFSGNVTLEEVIFSDATDITYSFEGDDNILSRNGDTTELHLDLAETIIWGDRTVQVKGNGSPGERYSDKADLYITDFDIEIAEPKNQNITDTEPNNVATYIINLIRYNSYNRAVTVITDLTSDNYPGIISSSIFENGGIFLPGEITTKLIVYAESSISDPIVFTVTGTDAPTDLQRLDSGSLMITNGSTPDFLINITPGSRIIEPGGATTYTITATRIDGFNGTIILSTNLLALDNRVESADFYVNDLLDNELPDGVNEATLSVISKTGVESSSTPTTFIVFGDNDGLQRSASADLIIYTEPETPSGGGGSTPTARDFSIDIDPDEQTVMAGDTTTYIVIINRTNFTGDILLSNRIANDSNIKSAILDQTLIDNETDTATLTVITEAGAKATTVPIIITGTAIVDRRETEREGEAVLYIIREEEVTEEIIVPEEELPSTGPESTWLLLGLAALLMTTVAYKQLQLKLRYQKNK